MMDYQEQPCIHCEKQAVIYHQYIADARCESCGEWQEEDDD